MSPRNTFVFRAITTIGVLLTAIFGAWWLAPTHIAHNFSGSAHFLDFLLFLLVSYIVWHETMTQALLWYIAKHIRKPFFYAPQPGLKVAFITTFVPSSESHELLHRILPAMKNVDYPHDVWLLDEGDDAEAKRICEQYGIHYFTRKNSPHYNTPDGIFATKTKGGNHNAWYHAHGHAYDVVAQMDTDFVPHREFLNRTLGFFRNPNVAFVGTPQIYGNTKHSLIARGAAQQTYTFYGPMLRGLHGIDMTLLIGANHVVRVEALKDIGFYNAHLTEDLLTGMHMHSRKWRSVYVPLPLAIGEGPSSWPAYFSQQMRWAFGCMDILFKYTRSLSRSMRNKHARYYFFLQQHYFTGLLMGVGVVLFSLYAFFGIAPVAMDLKALLSVYGPLLLWQTLIHGWLQRYFIRPEVESGALWSGRFISIAAWPIYLMALIGVLRGKRLTYKVTPKGDNQVARTPLSTFAPHLVIGTIAATDMLAASITGNDSLVMLFWMALTAFSMYGVVLVGMLPPLVDTIRSAWTQRTTSPDLA